jgi:3-methyladenine DNA glycosylase AlkD
MRIPNAENAILDVGKLRDYCLSAAQSKGKDKARVFMSALGVRQTDALWLRAEILRRLPSATAVQQIEDVWGVRYAVDMEITHNANLLW